MSISGLRDSATACAYAFYAESGIAHFPILIADAASISDYVPDLRKDQKPYEHDQLISTNSLLELISMGSPPDRLKSLKNELKTWYAFIKYLKSEKFPLDALEKLVGKIHHAQFSITIAARRLKIENAELAQAKRICRRFEETHKPLQAINKLFGPKKKEVRSPESARSRKPFS
jgi:hypothetical protein